MCFILVGLWLGFNLPDLSASGATISGVSPAFAPFDFPLYVNVALKKPVFASGYTSENEKPKFVTDGLANTVWMSENTADSQWIYVDLYRIKQLHGFALRWNQQFYAKSFQVFISKDAKDWQLFYSKTNGCGGSDRLMKRFEARYVYVALEQPQAEHYSLSEFEVIQMQPAAPPVQKYRILKDNINPRGIYRSLFLAGNYLFAACNRQGMLVYDVSNPENPQYVYTLDTLDAYYVAVNGNLAYIADGEGGFKIADLEKRTIIKTLVLGGTATDIEFYQQYALISCGSQGLQIVDIADPYQPAVIGSAATDHFASAVTVQFPYAYVADWQGGIKIFDLQTLSNPLLLAHIPTSLTYDTAVQGNYLFAADSIFGLAVYDISDFNQITKLAGYTELSICNQILLSGNQAYVADGSRGVQVLNISDIFDIKPLELISTDYAAFILKDGFYVYSAEDAYGLKVIKLGIRRNRSAVVKSIATNHTSQDLALSEKYALVANEIGSVHIIDIGQTNTASVVKTVFGMIPFGVAVKDTYALVSNIKLHVIDFSKVEQADIVNVVDGPAVGKNHVYGNYCFASLGCCGVMIYDISDPLHGYPVSSFPTANVQSCFAQGDYLYIAASNYGLRIFDISHIDNPQSIISFPLNFAHDVNVVDDLAYVPDGDQGLQIIDVSNPERPQIINTVKTGGNAVGIDISGQYAYLANSSVGLQIVDIKNPLQAKIVKTIHSKGQPNTVKVCGKNVYLLDGLEGLIIIGDRL
jgi:hypothetical protein